MNKIYKKSSKGPEVRQIQQALIDKGYSVGKQGADGDFGANTEKAVKEYQKANKLTVDGKVGPLTWAALFDGSEPEKPKPEPSKKPADNPLVRAMIDDAYAANKRGDLYMFGAKGEKASIAVLDKLKARNPSYFTSGRYEYLKREIEKARREGRTIYAFDCSGLVWYKAGRTTRWGKAYNANTTLASHCAKITKAELLPGDVVGSSGHIGIVGWDGEIVEAAGGNYGVVVSAGVDVRTAINGQTGKLQKHHGAWTKFGRLKV